MESNRESIVVLTGAGVSADSGLATFRGAGGLWEGHRVEDVATPEAWERDPATVWRFYQMRRAGLHRAQPNEAHRALARLEESLRRVRIPFLLVTQNVDDLHDRAGSQPLHMHGELSRLRCESCGFAQHDLEHLDPDVFVPCAWCPNPRTRPDVVWFGEMPYHLEAIGAALSNCTHFIAIGTSGLVYPAAGFLTQARAYGARTWVNSLDPPENLHPEDRFLPGRAADVVPRLAAELEAGLRL